MNEQTGAAAGTPQGTPAAASQAPAAGTAAAAPSGAPAGTTAGAAGSAEPAAPPAPKADAGTPAPLSYTLTVPTDSPLDPKVVERITAAATTLQLPQPAAEAMLALAHAEAVEVLQQAEQARQKGGVAYQARVQEYANAALAHPELGKGSARELQAAQLRAQLVLNRLDPEGKLSEILDVSGFGAHPEVLLLFNRIHALTGEQPLARPDVVASTPKATSMKEAWYNADGSPKEPAGAPG